PATAALAGDPRLGPGWLVERLTIEQHPQARAHTMDAEQALLEHEAIGLHGREQARVGPHAHAGAWLVTRPEPFAPRPEPLTPRLERLTPRLEPLTVDAQLEVLEQPASPRA